MTITTGDIPVTGDVTMHVVYDDRMWAYELHCVNCGHIDDHFEIEQATHAALEHVCCDRCHGTGWIDVAVPDDHHGGMPPWAAQVECDCREASCHAE